MQTMDVVFEEIGPYYVVAVPDCIPEALHGIIKLFWAGEENSLILKFLKRFTQQFVSASESVKLVNYPPRNLVNPLV